jgi:Domain of unknown function (DUF4166)
MTPANWGTSMNAASVRVSARRAVADQAELLDLRFRTLVPAGAWDRLPPEVQKRFTKRLSGVATAVYRGFVVRMDVSIAGWILAQACRLFGAPLPLCPKTGVAALVSVSEDTAGGGQCWTRIYARPGRFPQVIQSAKRFCGPTGIEEYLGRGLGMALRIESLQDGIAFVSDHYFLELGRIRVRIPAWFTPGRTRVTHRQIAGSSFLFGLDLYHPLAGKLLRQEVLFEDVE